jgi:formate hydrogenlyase transcriptional activator
MTIELEKSPLTGPAVFNGPEMQCDLPAMATVTNPAFYENSCGGVFSLEGAMPSKDSFEGIMGQSALIRKACKQAKVVAPTDSTVLILGETGTGKERFAQAIHNLSPRCDRPFIKINCAAIPAGLVESELFGHERGAFTGAVGRRTGRFEMAHGGTLFLDEIGDFPLELQPKLLRVLQEHEFERVGGTQSMRVNVRIVAATSRNLAQLVSNREFRADLFYRLNIFPIYVPPLRERSEDVPFLVRHFVDLHARRMGKSIKEIPIEVMDVLSRYSWPGNVRELQNVIERAVILSSGQILRPSLDELQFSAQIVEADFTDNSEGRMTLKGLERECIIRALAATNWVLGGPKGAAARLGLARTSLIAKMRKLGITRAQA